MRYSEQQEIVRLVESLFALAGQLEARLAKAQGQVNTLTPSLLARAFAGKLVPPKPQRRTSFHLAGAKHQNTGNRNVTGW